MKTTPTIGTLLGLGFVTALGFEIGIFQRALDSRSIVEDGVVGSAYWIQMVDGNPVDRVRHGYVISRVPYALLEPGDRVMRLAAVPHPAKDNAITEFHAKIEKGVNYRLSKNAEGNPELIANK